MCQASSARSRAVVIWPSAGQPEEFLNTVPVMPSSFAFLFMRSAKASSRAGDAFGDHDAGIVARLHDDAAGSGPRRDLGAVISRNMVADACRG